MITFDQARDIVAQAVCTDYPANDFEVARWGWENDDM